MAKKQPFAYPPRIVIASHNLGKMGFLRSTVNKCIRKILGKNAAVEVFSAQSPKRALKALTAETLMLVVDYQLSNTAGEWRAFKVVREARKLNKKMAIVIVTKPKDKRLYDKEQPIAYLALGKSLKRKLKFKKELRKQLKPVLSKPEKPALSK